MLQVTTSLEQVREFLRGTLLYVQQGHLCAQKSLWEEVQHCVDLLKDKGLITVTVDSQGQTMQVTKLGKATYKGEQVLHLVHICHSICPWTTQTVINHIIV